MPTDHADVFACPGEMAARCASFDWSTTALGPVDEWSQGLRTTVATMLRTRFPMCLSWGPDLVLVYNDGFIPTLGAKHPTALGARIADVFAEIWDEVGYLQWGVLAGGDAVYAEELPLVLERGHGPEETFYTFCYSHVPDSSPDAPGPGGVLAVVTETTHAVVGARRMALLHGLASATTEINDRDLALEASLQVLAGASGDLERGACYLPDPEGDAAGTLHLAGSFGVDYAWPPTAVLGADDTDGPDAVELALELRSGPHEIGLLSLVPHPMRPLDEEHETFLHLVADHVGQLLTLASTRADEQRRIESLAAADEAKSTFLSNVSHEFRTPLTLLLGPLEDALADGVEALAASDLTAMHQSAHRLLRMVNGLLEVSRSETDRSGPELEPTDVVALTDDLLSPFRAAAERSGVVMTTVLDGDIGTIDLDARLWETILLNLVANALKYTWYGSVDVELVGGDDTVSLRVSDTGIGIPADEHTRVFERFHRVGGPAGRTIEGTGLGLALVAEAVASLGGEVVLDSVAGAGSTFTVRVPRLVSSGEAVPSRLDRGAADALAADVTPATAHHETGSSSQRAIVVVDDNPGMRERLRHVLAALGPVVTCADGLEALDVLRHRPVDLVVSDVMMPRLDGTGLLRAIRSDPDLGQVPVVLLSARAGVDAATEALDLGADDYVVKPFTHDELVARCRTTIELAGLRSSRAAERARTTMLAGISHDMQTPISVVRAVLSMLADESLTLEARRELVQRGTLRAEQLERLVAQFLDWARLATGTVIAPRLESVPVAELLAAVGRHHPRGLDLPDIDLDLAVTCDRARTERILHNLVDNARAAARTRVQVEVGVRDDVVEVSVSDDGAGVDQEVRRWLFDAFSPAPSSSGSGLGLHVSRAAARAQGGELDLASTGPTGSRFVLRLPKES